MADKKISELTNITGANVDDANDELTIVDSSEATTKAITREELFKDIDGDITLSGTVDGRDVASDGTKLDGIEVGADVTDTPGVRSADALMDDELADIAAVKGLDQGVATTDSPDFADITRGGSQVYSRDNIVGTVSESSGTPTGGVIASGSNANGSYVKYADGSMTCRIKRLTLTRTTAPNCDGDWTFPEEFVNTDELSVAATLTGKTDATSATTIASETVVIVQELGPVTTGSLTTTGVTVNAPRIDGMTDFAPGDELYVSVVAHGRWY